MTIAARADAGHAAALGFTVAGTAYVLPLGAIREVLRPLPLARPPFSPPSLLGIANLRGAVLPVVSAARLLGRAAAGETGTGEAGTEETGASRILVLDRDAPCGLLVDGLCGERTGSGSDSAPPFPADALLAAAFAQRVQAQAGGGEDGPAAGPAPGAPRTRGEEALSILCFAVRGQAYALPLDAIEAVRGTPGAPASVADSDPVVAGLVAHRGGVLPVVPLARLLGLPCPAVAGPMVVARLAGGPVGLVVDALAGIERVPLHRLDAPPSVLTRGTGETRIDRIARRDDGTLVAVLAADRLFDAPTQDRLARLRPSDPATSDAATEVAAAGAGERFVAFDVGGRRFAVPIAAVEGVMRRPDRLAAVPGLPGFVLGAVTLQGRAVPLLDGGERLGVSRAARRDGGAMLLAGGGTRIALAVDAFAGVIDADAVAATPDFPRSPASTGRNIVTRVANHLGACVFIVDPDALLDEAARDALRAACAATAGAASI